MILTNDCSADDLDQVLNNDCSADHRKCNGVCDNMLQVNLGDQNLTLTEDLQVSKIAKVTQIRWTNQVTVNENTYTSQQAQKLKSQPDLFSVSEIGETLVVSSLRHQLWVEWHNDGTVEIGVGQDFTALLNTFTFSIVRDISFLLKTFTFSFAKDFSFL